MNRRDPEDTEIREGERARKKFRSQLYNFIYPITNNKKPTTKNQQQKTNNQQPITNNQ